ncbi:MBL fold metallo-hydrolase [candidate division KSB1 bacterium]|nr:MBL fold metallo-hydrolase [candidate division KSB1 bacterium]
MKWRESMKNNLVIIFSILFLTLIAATCNSDPSKNLKNGEVSMIDSDVKITILYDNYVFEENTKADWGFSCLIEGPEKTILFDAGTDGDILMGNIRALNVDLSEVDCIVISHDHRDHSGGLDDVLRAVDETDIFLPSTFNVNHIPSLQNRSVHVKLVNDPEEICAGVYLTGELGSQIKEQSLILNKKDGAVIVTGCSHPGIVHIIKTSKSIVENNIQLVVGGFHLLRHSDEEMNAIIKELKELNVQNIGPTHCTGERQIELFKEEFSDGFVQLGTGRVLEF